MRRETFIRTGLVACALLLSTLSAPAHASARQQQQQQQGATLSGRVTDARGDAVAGATVTLRERARTQARLSTQTDAAGAYRFERLAPGEYIVEAEAQGFAAADARGVSVTRDAGARLDVRLEVAGVSTEVVVTAADAPQTADEVSKAVTAVTAREMDERDEATVAESLRTVPGLRVQQLGGPGSLVSIKTRGLRNQDTSVLIDGQRFRDPAAAQGDATSFLSDFQLTGASRVEVLRGSGASLYGTNAVGGVVNVVTDEGGGPFRGQLFAEGGGSGFARARAQFSGSAGEADRLAFSAGVSHLNSSGGVDGDDAARSTNAQGRALLRLTPTATLSARVYASDAFAQLNEDPQAVGTLPVTGIIEARPLSREELRRYERGTPLAQLNLNGATFLPAANDADFSRAGRFFSGALAFAQRPSEAFGYTVSYHGLVTRNSFREGPSVPGDPADFFFEPRGSTVNDFDGSVHTLTARADFRLGRHNLVDVGYEFERENFFTRFLDVTPAGNSSAEVDERSHSFFIQDQLRFLDDRLQLSAAFRAQTFRLGSPRFTPSAGAPYAGLAFDSPPNAYTGDGSVAYLFRSSGTKLRGHVGNGFRKPSLYERFGTFYSSFFGYSALGDPRLAPERSIAFDAGVDQTLASNRVRLSATYFYTRLQEVVSFGDTPGDPFGRFSGFVNTGGGLARGVELSGEFAPSRSLRPLRLVHAHEQRPAARGRRGRPARLRRRGSPVHARRDRTHRLARRGQLRPRRLLRLSRADFRPATFANRAYRFDGMRKGDVTGSYTLPLSESRRLRLFGKIENVFGQDYYENGFRTPGRQARAGAALHF